MNEFLPYGFEELKPVSRYIKPSKMEEGGCKFRFLLRPIAGWLDWRDKKPLRYFPQNKPEQVFNNKGLQRFWMTYVWDYKQKELLILDITQATIIKPLILHANDPEWGDFKKYDITIVRTPRGETSEYNVKFSPPKPMDSNIEEAFANTPVNLEAVYINEDPWSYFEKIDKDASGFFQSTSVEVISDEEAFQLDDLIGENNDYRQRLLQTMNLESLNKISKDAYPQVFKRATDKFGTQPLPF